MILFGGSLLIFVYIWFWIAWQQASHGNYVVALIIGSIFAAVALLVIRWLIGVARAGRNR